MTPRDFLLLCMYYLLKPVIFRRIMRSRRSGERAPTRLHHPCSPLLCSVGKTTVDVRWFSIDNAASRLGFFLVQLVRVNWLFCNLP